MQPSRHIVAADTLTEFTPRTNSKHCQESSCARTYACRIERTVRRPLEPPAHLACRRSATRRSALPSRSPFRAPHARRNHLAETFSSLRTDHSRAPLVQRSAGYKPARRRRMAFRSAMQRATRPTTATPRQHQSAMTRSAKRSGPSSYSARGGSRKCDSTTFGSTVSSASRWKHTCPGNPTLDRMLHSIPRDKNIVPNDTTKNDPGTAPTAPP